VAHAAGRRAVPAGTAFQRAQRRRARSQPAGFPGIHDRAPWRSLDGRGDPRGRRGSNGALRRELSSRKLSTGLGDEGGFAPEIDEPEEVLRLLVQAISDAGYKAGAEGVSIALDPAASEFRQPDGRYQVAGDLLDSRDMIDRLTLMTQEFPVHLIEDGLGEDDDAGWITLTARLGDSTELVGDDIFCTNPAIIRRGIAHGIGNAAVIKLNQIGTVTETLQAMAWPSAARPGTGSSSPTAPGKPRIPSSPTWPSAPAAAT
jgi:hypothetical protein